MANRRANPDNMPLVCHAGDGAVIHIRTAALGVLIFKERINFVVHGQLGSYGGEVTLGGDAEHPCAIEMYASQHGER
jgi:hypothetical protein